MIKPEQIPDEVIKAAFNAAMLQPHNSHTDQIIAAVTEAINAWPGASLQTHWNNKCWLDLPLPQEGGDD